MSILNLGLQCMLALHMLREVFERNNLSELRGHLTMMTNQQGGKGGKAPQNLCVINDEYKYNSDILLSFSLPVPVRQ
jgi:hypothetical protein